jgi:glycine cleavage system H protein
MQVDKYQIPENLYYDTNDFWIQIKGEEALVGMTDFGQSNTGDILYLELMNGGEKISRGKRCGSIESGKWVGNLTAPVSGSVLENNSEVVVNPRKINADAYGTGWMYRIKLSNPDEVKSLLTAKDYAAWVVEQMKNDQEMN